MIGMLSELAQKRFDAFRSHMEAPIHGGAGSS